MRSKEAFACSRSSESVPRSQDLVRIPIVITEPTGEGQSTLFALP